MSDFFKWNTQSISDGDTSSLVLLSRMTSPLLATISSIGNERKLIINQSSSCGSDCRWWLQVATLKTELISSEIWWLWLIKISDERFLHMANKFLMVINLSALTRVYIASNIDNSSCRYCYYHEIMDIYMRVQVADVLKIQFIELCINNVHLNI